MLNKKLARAIEELAENREEAKRLLRKARPIWSKNNKMARALDNDTCRLCDFTLCLEVHHIIPVAQGGSDKIGNLVTLCPNHHALADRNLIPHEELLKAVAKRTHKGRLQAFVELVEYAARELHATDDDPIRLAAVYEKLKEELPRSAASIYGSKQVSASLDSFPPFPRDSPV